MAIIGANPAIDPAKIFAGIKDAKASFQANYIRAGHYLFRLDKIELGQSRALKTFMAVNLTTVYIVSPSGMPTEHKVGESCTHMIMYNDSFLGNVKAMISHLLEVPPDEIGLEECMALVAPDQPLAGKVIEVFADTKPMKKNPSAVFTNVVYKRMVPPDECIRILPAHTQSVYFPNDALAKMAKYLADQAKAPALMGHVTPAQ